MHSQRAIHPKIFLLWIGMISITMTFSALSSAFLVKKANTILLPKLPYIFTWNTIIILLSSFTGYLSHKYVKKSTIYWLMATLLLGFIFLYGQYIGWRKLVQLNIYFVGNPIGSFLYIFTGLHALHLFSGIIVLIIFIFLVLQNKIKVLYYRIGLYYWHFLSILWIYLYIFLTINH